MSIVSSPSRSASPRPPRSASRGEAWLENSRGDKIPLDAACSLGRLGSNHIALDDEKASRRHTTIERQGSDEFWLIDLGSRNGTYLNSRRIAKATRLFDDDKILIGTSNFTFHQPSSRRNQFADHTLTSTTLQETRTRNSWLMVIDLESSTEFTRRLAPEKLPAMMGRWLDDCRDLIEQHGGCVNKYLGDGLLAYWHDENKMNENVARALTDLKVFQERSSPPFRLALHFGAVTISGCASLGEEGLMGPEVNFVFRMERLASQMGISRLISEPAQKGLAAHLALSKSGTYPVNGFDNEYLFYEF